MPCNHDPLYRINNEKSGGAGCPMCASSRRRVMAVHATNDISRITVDRGWIDSNRSTEPIKAMADKTVNAYNDWQAFIDKCNATD